MNEPYRFLRNYEFTPEDTKVFRGRKREAAALVSEVTTRHLVILFAPTGTGKSSLINAAVRPALVDRGYRTLYIQPKRDAEEVIQRELDAEGLLDRTKPNLGDQLRAAAQKADQPIVLFLDQFEEFFLYSVADQPDRAREFVRNVAALYRDRASGVHFLFSLREDFFVEMDIFRDEIPMMFQSNSSLRLRAFEREPAREAIEGPAGVFGVKFVCDRANPGDADANRKFVDHILDDLQKTGPQGRISPIHLQIVCDTLWRERRDGMIDAAAYDRLGQVKCILVDRFRSDFAGQLSDEDLLLFQGLMPLLRSDERGTKRVLPINLLPAQLDTTEQKAANLVSRLLSLRLLHQGTHGTIEWASDYLSGHQDHLLKVVRSIRLRRLLDRAMERARGAAAVSTAPEGAARREPPTKEELDARYMSDADFEEISSGWRTLAPEDAPADAPHSQVRLDLTAEQAAFLLDAALEHCEHLELWSNQAENHGIDVVQVLRQKIVDPNVRTVHAENAIRQLSMFHTVAAWAVLREAVNQTAWAPLVAAEAGRRSDGQAIAIVRDYLERHPPSPSEAAVISRHWTAEARELVAAAARRERALSAPGFLGTLELRSPAVGASPSLSDAEWDLILRKVRDGRVVPIIGMGPMAGGMARFLAREVNYPGGSADLAQVAEYAVYRTSHDAVCGMVSSYLTSNPPPDHLAALAALPITAFVTTRYDDFLLRALSARNREPLAVSWGAEDARGSRSYLQPSVERPLVYYLQGRVNAPGKAVITTSDRFDLVAAASSDSEAVPVALRARIGFAIPVFVDFEPGTPELYMVSAVFQSPMDQRNQGIVVSAEPHDADSAHSDLLRADAERLRQRPYWGSSAEFVENLVKRWTRYSA
jgi:hypothetical protein